MKPMICDAQVAFVELSGKCSLDCPRGRLSSGNFPGGGLVSSREMYMKLFWRNVSAENVRQNVSHFLLSDII